jgi:hypothetical protein
MYGDCSEVQRCFISPCSICRSTKRCPARVNPASIRCRRTLRVVPNAYATLNYSYSNNIIASTIPAALMAQPAAVHAAKTSAILPAHLSPHKTRNRNTLYLSSDPQQASTNCCSSFGNSSRDHTIPSVCCLTPASANRPPSATPSANGPLY